MKVNKKGCCYLLILLLTIWLCSCTRYTPPVESYQATQENQKATASDSTSVQAKFDEFTNNIFKEELSQNPLTLHCFVRHPQNYGIEIPEMTFGTLSSSSLKENLEDIKKTKKQLESFDTSLLTSDQLFTYKWLADYLDTELLSEGLELYYQPLSPQIGIQAQLPVILAEYSFHEKQDVENYLALLSQIDTYYKQLADFEIERAEAGLAPSDTTLDRIVQSCKDYMIRPENSFLTETFHDKLEEVPGLTEDEKNSYKEQHLKLLKEHFIPAYQNLSATLNDLKGKGHTQNGLSHLKNGKQYYEYLVASCTGSDSSIPELKRRIEKQLGNDMAEITLLLQNNHKLASELSSYSFNLTKPEEILNDLREQSKNDFPDLPGVSFIVKHVPKALESSLSPAFFMVPPIDSSNENIIYINGLSEQTNSQLYTTLAHEGYPGHLYQNLYFNQRQSCPLRLLISCGGYSEGWGTYAEIYSYSFENGLSDDLKKLLACNQSSILALYALLDIHIHYDGWDLAKTNKFLNTYYGIEDQEVTKEIFESIIDNPGNYLEYLAGYLEICTLRDAAKNTLGNRFSIKSFHKFILDMEGAPFRVIKPYFQTWLMTYDLKQ